jgi:phytoene synthase
MMESALGTLSHYGKSFRFAGRFLGHGQLQEAAKLYQFCRWVDDLADDSDDKVLAAHQLSQITESFLGNTQSRDPIINEYIQFFEKHAISPEVPITLVNGVKSDLSPARVQDQDQLIQYAYQVAGVVGLMMCPILGAEKQGYNFAVDLGLAMQLTNIARDVKEDAEMGRRYLPYSWCPHSPEEILSDDKHIRQTTVNSVTTLLQLAEKYYDSARVGLQFLPPQSRRAIAVALSVYRHIGILIAQQHYQYWLPRCVVPPYKKVWVAASALWQLSTFSSATSQVHQKELHLPLAQFKQVHNAVCYENGL